MASNWSRRISVRSPPRVAASRHPRLRRAPRPRTALAAAIARIAWRRWQAGDASDPAALDANYVRRSDAELALEGLKQNGCWQSGTCPTFARLFQFVFRKELQVVHVHVPFLQKP
jgi:hypothetical protein